MPEASMLGVGTRGRPRSGTFPGLFEHTLDAGIAGRLLASRRLTTR